MADEAFKIFPLETVIVYFMVAHGRPCAADVMTL